MESQLETAEKRSNSEARASSPIADQNFVLLLIAQTISSFGDALTNLTLLILVNKLTGSTAAIATLTIVVAIPSIVFGLFAGVYVDKFDRKRIMLASDLLRGILVLGLLFVKSKDQLMIMYLLSFLQAAVGTFFGPARGAVVQQILKPDQYMAANSMSQTGMVVSGVIGAALAGMIVGLTDSFAPAFVLDALTFFVSFVLVLFVVVPKLEPQTKALTEGIIAPLLEGLRIVSSNPVLVAVLVGGGVTMFGLGASNVLFTPYIINILRVPVTWLGTVGIAETFAMILSSVLVVGFAARIKPQFVISSGLFSLGVLVSLNAVLPNIWYFVGVNFLIGLVVSPLEASFGTLMQGSVKNEVMGRVGSAFNIVMNGASLISMAFSGVLASLIGVRNVFAVSGVIVCVAAVITLLMLRTQTRVEVSS
jgi:MFS family permease